MEKQKSVKVKLNGFYPSFVDIAKNNHIKYRTIKQNEEIELYGVSKFQLQFICEAGKYLWSNESLFCSNHNGIFYFATKSNEDFQSLLALAEKYSVKCRILNGETARLTLNLEEVVVDLGMLYHAQIVKTTYIGKHANINAVAFSRSNLLKRAKNVYKAIYMSSPNTYQFMWYGDIMGSKNVPLFGKSFDLCGKELPDIIKRHLPDNFEFPNGAIGVKFYNKQIIEVV